MTSSSVRLVNSITRELRNEWHSPQGYSINVATANATQVCPFEEVARLIILGSAMSHVVSMSIS